MNGDSYNNLLEKEGLKSPRSFLGSIKEAKDTTSPNGSNLKKRRFR
jgi:hypothetical protein